MLLFVKKYTIIASLLASNSAVGTADQDVMKLRQLKQTVNIASLDEDLQCPATSAELSDELSMLQVHSSRVEGAARGACGTLKCNREWCGDIWDAFEAGTIPGQELPVDNPIRKRLDSYTVRGNDGLSRVEGWDLIRANGQLRQGLQACVELYLGGMNQGVQGVTCRRLSNSHSDTDKQETCLKCRCERGLSRDFATGQAGSSDNGAGAARAAEAAAAEDEASGEEGYIPQDPNDPERIKRLEIAQQPQHLRDYDSMKKTRRMPRKKQKLRFSKDSPEVNEYVRPNYAVRPGLPGDPDGQDYRHYKAGLGDLPTLPDGHPPLPDGQDYRDYKAGLGDLPTFPDDDPPLAGDEGLQEDE